jgi:crotonyl-CoA reductase
VRVSIPHFERPTTVSMDAIRTAILEGVSGDELAAIPLPETMRAAVVRKDEVDMFAGLESHQKDPRKSLHIDEVAIPPLGPNEVLIAPMASAINFNTVWTSIFEPLPTFGFLERMGRLGELVQAS